MFILIPVWLTETVPKPQSVFQPCSSTYIPVSSGLNSAQAEIKNTNLGKRRILVTNTSARVHSKEPTQQPPQPPTAAKVLLQPSAPHTGCMDGVAVELRRSWSWHHMDAPREWWGCSKLKLREAGGNAFSANSHGDRARCWERLKGEVQSQLFGGAFPQLNFHRCKARRKRVGVRMREPKEPLFLNIIFIQATLGQEPALVGSLAAATPNSHLL